MFSYTTKGVNIISFIISIIIFIIIDTIFFNTNQIDFKVSFNSSQSQVNLVNTNIIETTNNTITETKESQISSTSNWTSTIPQINLQAEIAEGTTQDVLNKYVGHFTETPQTTGNVGLAAHNRGYDVNYFKDLKNLDLGAEVIYKNGEFEKIYIVEEIEIIKNTDWSYLENTEDNRITLITCVENQPEYRRCVQAVEKLEE